VTTAAPCTIHSHYLLIKDTDAERCPNCGRKLWRRPPTTCARHSVHACGECFTEEEFFKLRYGAEPISEVEDEDEND
jgi:predicted amidophosphoribosyltransferase